MWSRKTDRSSNFSKASTMQLRRLLKNANNSITRKISYSFEVAEISSHFSVKNANHIFKESTLTGLPKTDTNNVTEYVTKYADSALHARFCTSIPIPCKNVHAQNSVGPSRCPRNSVSKNWKVMLLILQILWHINIGRNTAMITSDYYKLECKFTQLLTHQSVAVTVMVFPFGSS